MKICTRAKVIAPTNRQAFCKNMDKCKNLNMRFFRLRRGNKIGTLQNILAGKEPRKILMANGSRSKRLKR